MTFTQPIISFTDDYLVIKVPRQIIQKDKGKRGRKSGLTAKSFLGILKNTPLSRLDSVKASHEITQLWQKTIASHQYF